MTEAISGKLAELKASRPADPEFKKWMDQSDLWCWMYSLYRITGRRISRKTVATVLQGEFRDDIPLSDYAFAGNCRDMYADMRGCLYMDADLDARMLSRWARLITSPDTPRQDGTLYRLNNPIVYEWEFIPPHFREVGSLTDGVLKSLQPVERQADPIDAAARLHLELNRLYLFGEDTVLLSLAALFYLLMKLNLPFPEISATDVEYNKMTANYLETRDSSAFSAMLERSIFNRLDSILDLLKQAKPEDQEQNA